MHVSKFSVPVEQRYFEDYAQGAVVEYGPMRRADLGSLVRASAKVQSSPSHRRE
jgi:hypothetical protein